MEGFRSAYLTIAEARARIEELVALSKSYWAEKPGAFGTTRDDAFPGKLVHIFTIQRQLPDRCHTIVSGILQDLRHALDQAASASVFALTGEDRRDTHFPLARTQADFQRLRPKLETIQHVDVVDTIARHRPFGDSNPLLYALTLANQSKHRRLIEATTHLSQRSCFMSGDLTKGEIRMIVPTVDTPRGDFAVLALSDEAVNAVVTEASMMLIIAFARDVDGLAGMPAPDTMLTLSSEVELIVQDIEAATRSVAC
ncbi:hypothetical protein SAMN05428969_3412 [Devosia sp. YR412]|nr:hypothetical protein SAMN05428969_3412 [Devosia sp. YR412]